MAYLYNVRLTRVDADGAGENRQLAVVRSIGARGARYNYPDMAATRAAIPRQLFPAWDRETGGTGDNGLWYGCREAVDIYRMTLKNTRGIVIARLEFAGYEFEGEKV